VTMDNRKVLKSKQDLEIEKIGLEIKELTASSRWPRKLAHWLPFLAALIGTGGFVWSIYQFNAQQRDLGEQRKSQAEKERLDREQELKRRYWEEQLKIYKMATDIASRVANANHLEEANDDIGRFWIIYWGEMSLIEHPEVKRAMVNFGHHIEQWENTRKRPDKIRSASYQIAQCCRKSLMKTWNPIGMDFQGECKFGEAE